MERTRRRIISMVTKVSKLLGTSAKWAAIAVVLAMVDARMGGKPKLLEVLRSVMGGLESSYHCRAKRLGIWPSSQANGIFE